VGDIWPAWYNRVSRLVASRELEMDSDNDLVDIRLYLEDFGNDISELVLKDDVRC
jgi:hypothetical protein